MIWTSFKKPLGKRGPGSENFFLTGPSFPLEKPAGDLPRGVGHLLIVDDHGEEIDSFPDGFGGRSRDQHDALSKGYQDRSIRLFGHSPCFHDKISAFQVTPNLKARSEYGHKLTLFPKDNLFFYPLPG
jgi:hypothetical protein